MLKSLSFENKSFIDLPTYSHVSMLINVFNYTNFNDVFSIVDNLQKTKQLIHILSTEKKSFICNKFKKIQFNIRFYTQIHKAYYYYWF